MHIETYLRCIALTIWYMKTINGTRCVIERCWIRIPLGVCYFPLIHYVNFAMKWGTPCTFHRVGPPTPKRGGFLSGDPLLAAGARHLKCLQTPCFKGLPAEFNLRANWAVDQSFYFFLSHIFFTKYTNISLFCYAKLTKWVVERLQYTNSK